ncbi:MAG: class I SAM-dependent methyltransferase [Dehalococcoidia bacterium]|nr:class I SAM-dependent methyltransferase [Dehalococcoidia bacterium]
MIDRPGPKAERLPKLYTELASWFHLLTAPEEYADEAEFFGLLFRESCAKPPRTVLELGSGGGNNAFHLKAHFDLTLVDLSPAMLAVSRAINPECEHLEGDMRSVRLGRLFDVVFIHDAVDYLTTPADLRAGLETSFAHCRPGGAAVFAPDDVRETFAPKTEHGGHDGAGKAVRYLEWSYDPDPADNVYTVEYAYLLREADGTVRVEHERHFVGLFARDEWLGLLRDAGFQPRALVDPWGREVFLAVRPA